MMQGLAILTLLGPLAAEAGSTFSRRQNSRQRDACSAINDELEIAIENDNLPLRLDGADAYECLGALPFYSDLAGELIVEIRKYLQFHSTLEALKDPPEDYAPPPIDILGGLDTIADKDYDSQYFFDMALVDLFDSANDGHLRLDMCTESIFLFHREAVSLVSISEDGVELPEIYVQDDAKIVADDPATDLVSPVAKIDDEDAVDYLERMVERRRSQDPDTRWNEAFASKAVLASGDLVSADGAFVNNYNHWPGSNVTRLEFRNGTYVDLQTFATLNGDVFGRDAYEVWEIFCDATTASQPDLSTYIDMLSHSYEPSYKRYRPSPHQKRQLDTDEGPEGYPEPFIRDSLNQIMGYHLDDDTTVMQIPSFDNADMPLNHSLEFALVASQVVEEATSTGRTKMIIDVSGNGGGSLPSAFDLFKLFFPEEFPYLGTRFRRHDAADVLAKIYGYFDGPLAPLIPFAYESQVRPNQEDDIDSLSDFIGNDTELNVPVSSMFANFNLTAMSDSNAVVSPVRGYGQYEDLLDRTMPFKAEDILIVSDGICASTCAAFVHFMTNIGGAQSLAFGGRPQSGAMQIIGGTRGTQVTGWDQIFGWFTLANQVYDEEKEVTLTQEEVDSANEAAPLGPASVRIIASGVTNFRNGYEDGDDDMPLQFKYQAADCRLFYTAENVLQPATVWKSAKEAVWGDGQCVEGSTGAKGSLAYKKNKKQKDDDAESESESEDEEDAGVQWKQSWTLVMSVAFFAWFAA